MENSKSKHNDGNNRVSQAYNNTTEKKRMGEKAGGEKEKQNQKQNQQNLHQRHSLPVNNKSFKKEQQHQQKQPQMFILPNSNKNNKKKEQQQQQNPRSANILSDNNESSKKKEQQNQRKTSILPANGKSNKKKQQPENTVKKVTEQKLKNNVKNAKDKKKENKSKGNKKPAKQVPVNKAKGSFCKTFLEIIFFICIFSITFLSCLYVVDIESYRSVRDLGARAIYSVVQLLPTEVVVKGSEVVEYVRPTVEVAVVKFRVLVNQTSTVLNNYPVLKDHWSNIKEISAVMGGQIAEYMRTVYKQIPIYYDTAKTKLF